MSRGGGDSGAIEEVEVASDGGGVPWVPVYFPNDRGMLSAEERDLPAWATPEDGARLLIEAVLAGPRSEDLGPAMPDGTTLGVTRLSDAALLYVDLVSTEHSRPPLSGSRMEMASVYSLVDTVLLNIPEIEAVVLLWNGKQLPTFGGHIDTSLPLKADADLVSR